MARIIETYDMVQNLKDGICAYPYKEGEPILCITKAVIPDVYATDDFKKWYIEEYKGKFLILLQFLPIKKQLQILAKFFYVPNAGIPLIRYIKHPIWWEGPDKVDE